MILAVQRGAKTHTRTCRIHIFGIGQEVDKYWHLEHVVELHIEVRTDKARNRSFLPSWL